MSVSHPAKILVIGVGGVGCIASYSLEYSGKTKVTAVIRSDYSHVTTKGFQIESCDYGTIESYSPSNVVSSIKEAVAHGPYEFIILTTKNIPDVSDVSQLIVPELISSDTSVVLIQNGIGIETPFFSRFPETAILSGVSMISSTNNHGSVNHEGKDSLTVGYFANHPTISESVLEAKCHRFLELYKTPHNSATYDSNVNYARWRKLVYNATINTICCLTDLDIGRVEIGGGMDTLVRPLMQDVLKLAKSDGVELDPSICENMIRSDDGVWYSPSMLVDERKDRCIELEVILGNALRIGEKNGCVDVPGLRFVYELLKLVQFRLKEKNGIIKLPEVRPPPGYEL